MWVLFASLNPISEGIRSVFIKKASKDFDSFIISWANYLLPVIIFTPFLFFIDLKFNSLFWIGMCGSSVINVAANILYVRSISKGDISSVMPMLSFTPIFLLLSGPFLLGEFPNFIGLIGILIGVVGSYLLNLDLKQHDLMAPFKSLLKNKGTRYMLIVAFLWSFSANLDKIAIQNSSTWQHISFTNILIFSMISIIVLVRKKQNDVLQKIDKKYLLIISAFTVGSYIFHMTALSLTLAAYVVAMKRMSGVISVFLGNIFLNEANLKQRLLGSFVMLLGVLLIVFS
jgi:drug/metabolite transporter (DMT)-like permease